MSDQIIQKQQKRPSYGQRLMDCIPHTAHQTAQLALSLYSCLQRRPKPLQWRSFKWKGMFFPNPLGPAGGMDKNARQVKAWWSFSAGFVEVGTITPLAQKPNPAPTLKRSYQEQTLWNHLGFPGEGVQAICKRLKQLKSQQATPIFANIGKNRHTPIESASEDYQKCILALSPYVSAFVINISSPNTKNLQALVAPQSLKNLLQDVRSAINACPEKKPFFIKWSPDGNEKAFLQSVDISLEQGAEGHIVCNSSIAREGLIKKTWPGYGGLSGAPLSAVSKQRLKILLKQLEPVRKNQMVVSVGGVLTPQDVLERLDMGADLVQVYSALVFNGPGFFKHPTFRKKM